jgi:bifunctional non-homologous end joining protein LigD
MAGDDDARVEAVRKQTKAQITHPDRVLYPDAGLSKLDVVEYYLGVAPLLLPYLRDRPLTLHRFPGGVGTGGFFEKDAPAGTPAFVETFTHWAEAPRRDVRFVLCNNLDTLAWLANIAAIEVHATLSQAGS